MKKIILMLCIFFISCLANEEKLYNSIIDICKFKVDDFVCNLINNSNIDSETFKAGIQKTLKNCNSGNGISCSNLSILYETANMYKNAFNYAKKDCDLDDKTACRKLGLYYISGKGTKQNIQKGYNYLIRACEKLNNGDSCSLLGFLFIEVKKYQSALKYFTKGCDLDSAESCASLTYLYSNGLGTNMDMKKAFDYSKKGCIDLEDGLSCGSLGFILMGNESKDSRTAAKKFFGICCSTTKAKECCNEYQNLNEQGY